VSVAVAVAFERGAVGVELPAVELHDQLLRLEQGVDQVARDVRVGDRPRQGEALAERLEGVLELGAGGTAFPGEEWFHAGCPRVTGEAGDSLGEVVRLEVLRQPGVVDEAREAPLGEGGGAVEDGAGWAGDPDAHVVAAVHAPENR
jgi:hypothetical protein